MLNAIGGISKPLLLQFEFVAYQDCFHKFGVSKARIVHKQKKGNFSFPWENLSRKDFFKIMKQFFLMAKKQRWNFLIG